MHKMETVAILGNSTFIYLPFHFPMGQIFCMNFFCVIHSDHLHTALHSKWGVTLRVIHTRPVQVRQINDSIVIAELFSFGVGIGQFEYIISK